MGRGAFGTVYLVRNLLERRLYAMKILKSSINSNEKVKVIREIEILKNARHPHILYFKEAFVNSTDSNLMIVTELAKSDL